MRDVGVVSTAPGRRGKGFREDGERQSRDRGEEGTDIVCS